MKASRLIVFGALALAGALLGAEGLTRVRAHARFGDYLDVYEIHHRLPSGLLVPLPDLDVAFAHTRVRTDEHGFRSPPVALPKPPRTLRLAFLGASTTFCSQVSRNEKTWPSLVQLALAQRFPDVTVEHVNAGVTSYTLADSRQALEERVAAVEPDVIVFYEAANEIAVDTHALAEAAGMVGPAHRPGWLERVSLLWKLVRKNREFLASQREGRAQGPKLQCDWQALAVGFEERLVELVQRAQRSAKVVALVTVATRFAREQPLEVQLANMEQSFTFMSYLAPEALLAGFEAYNGAIVRAARRTGAVLIEDHASLQGKEACFTDSVHFSEAGCEVMARRVIDGLITSSLFTEQVEALRTDTAPVQGMRPR